MCFNNNRLPFLYYQVSVQETPKGRDLTNKVIQRVISEKYVLSIT